MRCQKYHLSFSGDFASFMSFLLESFLRSSRFRIEWLAPVQAALMVTFNAVDCKPFAFHTSFVYRSVRVSRMSQGCVRCVLRAVRCTRVRFASPFHFVALRFHGAIDCVILATLIACLFATFIYTLQCNFSA